MDYAKYNAKPGEYVWDDEARQYIGRLSLDGTEDRRFTASGAKSFINNLLKKAVGFRPKDPQVFARDVLGDSKGSSDYLVRGYGLVVAKVCTLNLKDWLPELESITGSPIDLLVDHVAKGDEAEAKLIALSKVMKAELCKRDLAKLSPITEADIKLREQRSNLATEHKVKQAREQLLQEARKLMWNKVLAYRWNTVNFLTRGNKSTRFCHDNGDLQWLGIHLGKAGRKNASFAMTGYVRKMQEAVMLLLAESGTKSLDEYVWKYVEDHWTVVACDALNDLVYSTPHRDGFVVDDGITADRIAIAKQELWDGHVPKGK